MPSGSAFELQSKIFRRMGLDAPALAQVRKSRLAKAASTSASRKIERRAQRVQKKAWRSSKSPHPHGATKNELRGPSHAESSVADEESNNHLGESRSGDDDVESDELSLKGPGTDREEPSSLSNELGKKISVPRAVQERLAQDDADIEELERKLGIKKGRKSLPKAFKEDGLDELLGEKRDYASDSEDESRKRKQNFEDWLASKRSKGSGVAALSDEDSFSGFEQSCGSEDHDEDEAADACVRPQQRENPYVAPTTGAAVAKYIPPSRRTALTSKDETRHRLKKLIQGQINRLTDSNILSIVQALEDIYQRNARGDVTELLTDAIMAQVCKTESLPDQFFVLTGGFCAAIYKVVGSSFGSHLIRRVAIDLRDVYDKTVWEMGKQPSLQKEAYNLVTFLTQLYVFQVVSCNIIFDYMRRLLSELSEINIELLLRVCRMAGKLLRRDDPQALKHVSEVVNKSVSKLGYSSVSVRTKFMIETINGLKNSKPKAKGLDSAMVSEHVVRMRKRLGDLKSQPRRLEGLAPMGMGLADVEKADAHGKWWLVGASMPAYTDTAVRANRLARKGKERGRETSDEEDMDYILPDYPRKARAQGLSTSTQIAIFTALMTASDGEQGYQQFMNLRLKKDEQLEIARVLVQCVGSEAEYNEYYGQVGLLACANGRVRFALQDRLWKMFRNFGEALFGEEADGEESAESERMKDERRVSHVARFYASLVADGALGITVLKPLELAGLGQGATSFVERFLVSLLQACRGKEARETARVERVFGSVRGAPELPAGILWFLKSRLNGTGRLERVRLKVQALMEDAAAGGQCE
ncbi:hypothetical protein XA68_10071 [Ophiocordyceps unilateralis]|uniref:MI domain-containing protein n=1 Tax=Ophiocordyceps unilateralis TaxID=268505 RepID=A0A2A9PR29_OPHUN|nr:hypothetical protein XA68_10071 [Ophiocordyceps unilateralis]